MAIRQYVGARYVPRFTGLYDATQIYDALDVVDNGSGTSYIAKKTVPAGTPLSDTDYWFIYGASSGAIINLQNQINDMQDGSINGSLQNQIDDKITDIPNRHWLFLGDSYDTLHAGYSWIDGAASNLGIDGSHYEKRSAGGRGFYPTVPSYTWLNYLIANPVADDDAITDIVICGGANDVNAPQADLINGMQAFDQYIRTTYKNLKNVYLGFIGWQQTKTNRNKMITRAGYYRNIGTSLKWKYLNGVENIMKNPAYIDTAYTDYQHPTTDAVGALSIGIAEAIATGNCETYAQVTTTYTAGSDVTHYAALIMNERIRNGMISSYWGNTGMGALANLSGDIIIGTCNPDQCGMNIGVFHDVKVWIGSTSTMYDALLYYSDIGELHLILQDGATINSGVGFRLVAGSMCDIIFQ